MSDKCKDRVGPAYKETMKTLRELWKAYNTDTVKLELEEDDDG